jgi:CheY-like chemotaxis protein
MRRRILLADDDPILREIAGEHLRQAGYEVELVEDGALALRAVAAGRFDLIITDMVMPNLDGIELLQALKRDRPETPVIAISGGMSAMDPELILRAAKAVGAVSVLPKPLVRDSFLEAVRNALDGAAGAPA